MSDLFSFEEFMSLPREEVERLLEEEERARKERAAVRYKDFKVLPAKPQLVLDCIEYLRLNYSNLQEGLFRVNGNQNVVNDIRRCYEEGQKEDVLSYVAGIDNNVIATTLKGYFRLLKDPIIPKDAYDKFLDIVDSGETDQAIIVENIRKCLREEIPSPNIEVLAYLMKFFKEVCAESDTNKMVPKVLATCISPSLMRYEAEPGASAMGAIIELGLAIKVLTIMLEDIDFGEFLSSEKEQEMKDAIRYKPVSLPRAPTRKTVSPRPLPTPPPGLGDGSNGSPPVPPRRH